jgi:2-haloalkanoic acid dehalogenase type II
MQFSDFDALSFDCYGTLIDWESGIFNAMLPFADRAGLTLDREAALVAVAEEESAAQAATPWKLYPHLLEDIFPGLARRLGGEATVEEAYAFGQSVPNWPAFPDSVEALGRLKQRFKLVILSNVDVAGFIASAKRLEVPFDYVFTAQEVGSYKPNPQNFTHMLDKLDRAGVAKPKLLHVAQSLFHDHQIATTQGLATCWIDRREGTGWGATKEIPNLPTTDWRFPTLAAFADAVEAK